MHDSASNGVWAILVQRKGNYNEYVSKKIAGIISRLGYSKIVMKSDQEPSIKDVMFEAKKKVWHDIEKFQEDAKAECSCQVVIQHSPVGESQANGMIENCIQRIQDQIRAIKLDIEVNSDARLTPTHPAWPWLIEFAAQTLTFWRINAEDGLTAIQRIRGKCTTSPKPRFGEKVMYRIAKTIKLGKSEARWRFGVWMGTLEVPDEHMIGTKLGVVKCRAVAPMAEDKRFDSEALKEMQGTPWKPSTKNSGTRMRTYIKD